VIGIIRIISSFSISIRLKKKDLGQVKKEFQLPKRIPENMSAGYTASVVRFLEDDVDRIVVLLAQTVAKNVTSQYSQQITVWKNQVDLLKDNLRLLLDLKTDIQIFILSLSTLVQKRFLMST
jgi:hypothetical protein